MIAGDDRGVGVEVELLDALVAGEPGVVDAPDGAALVPVVALGHHQLGEEPQVGQLLAFGGGGDLANRSRIVGRRSARQPESIAATAACSVTPRRVDAGCSPWPCS